MKIILLLSIITIVISVGLITNCIELLDIPSNKNDTYAYFEKQKIDKRTDINDCEKKMRKNKIDFVRKEKRRISSIAHETLNVAFAIIIFQLILSIVILMMPKRFG